MNKTLIILLLASTLLFSQKVNIIPQLKKIEAGKIDEARVDLQDFKQFEATNPDVIFLEAVLEENGEKAEKLYETVYNNFPKSRFADAALFRSFSYFYALGLYKKAESLKELLKEDYPNSPYLKKTKKPFPKTDEMILIDSSPYQINDKTDFNFTVQVGAFGKYENAEKLKRKLHKEDYDINIFQKTVNNLKLNVVTLGKFKTKSEAKNLLSKLKTDYSIKGRIIKLD